MTKIIQMMSMMWHESLMQAQFGAHALCTQTNLKIRKMLIWGPPSLLNVLRRFKLVRVSIGTFFHLLVYENLIYMFPLFRGQYLHRNRTSCSTETLFHKPHKLFRKTPVVEFLRRNIASCRPATYQKRASPKRYFSQNVWLL